MGRGRRWELENQKGTGMREREESSSGKRTPKLGVCCRIWVRTNAQKSMTFRVIFGQTLRNATITSTSARCGNYLMASVLILDSRVISKL